MAPLPSRKALESMKRVDLQKLCKDYGVKANLKSEALIDLLLDTSTPVPTNAPTRRSVSTRLSSRAGPSRISSIVIHDMDDEDEEQTDHTEEKHTPDGQDSGIQSSAQAEPTPPPATRTRKGKEQTRLGVGRPIVAGGSGPRAITKSLSMSKAKRGKGSKSMKPTEATIVEEAETESHDPKQDDRQDDIPSQASHQQISTKILSPEASIDSLATIDKHVADALRPLHEQMKSMKSELELMQALKTEVGELKVQVVEMGSLREKVDALTATVQDLRKEADESASLRIETNQFKERMAIRPTPTTPKLQSPALKKRAGPSGFGFPPAHLETMLRQELSGSGSTAPSTSATNPARPHPGIAPTMLGKRPRDFTPSDVGEDNLEVSTTIDDIAKGGAKPSRKRAKMTQKEEGSSATEQGPLEEDGLGGAILEEAQEAEVFESAGAPSFTVFSGLDEPPAEFMDPPPPTEHLPDFFAPPSPLNSDVFSFPRQGSTTTSTANAAENQPPFAFSFQPLTSTPAHGMFMPSFPYPEPPQSPSPAGTNLTGFLNQHQPGRSDVFQAFGFPPPGRPTRTTGLRNNSGLSSGFINPATLTRLPSDHDQAEQATGSGARAVNEMAARPTDVGSSTGVGAAEAPQMKRTMYGTELEGDTRFGDFGVEGVGTTKGGFWAGGRY